MNNACPPLPLLLPPAAPKVTEWFPMSVSPVWPGEYEVRLTQDTPPERMLWDGAGWLFDEGAAYLIDGDEWRGVQL